MNKKKIAFISGSVIAVIAIVIAYFCFNPVSRNIDTVVTGVQFRMADAPDDYELKEITIKGTAYHYLFGNKTDYYRGWFSVEGYDYTFRGIIVVSLRNLTEISDFQPLWYAAGDPPHALGNLSATDLEEFVVYVFRKNDDGTTSWGDDNSLVICAPAGNRDEAVGILESGKYPRFQY